MHGTKLTCTRIINRRITSYRHRLLPTNSMTFLTLFNFYSAYAPQNFYTLFLIFILSFGIVSSRLVGSKVEPAQDCVSVRILKTKIFEKLMMVLNNFIGEQSEA